MTATYACYMNVRTTHAKQRRVGLSAAGDVGESEITLSVPE